LIEQGSRRLAINVPGLMSIDSAGIGMPIGCSGQMEQAHGKLRIASAQGTVARTLEVVHMDPKWSTWIASRRWMWMSIRLAARWSRLSPPTTYNLGSPRRTRLS
jgi:hypothetical protein